MGVNYPEYSFKGMRKPCDKTKKCIENAQEKCRLFSMCDLLWKRPKTKPTRLREYRKPMRQTNVIVHLPQSKFYEKQREIKRRKNARKNSKDI